MTYPLASEDADDPFDSAWRWLPPYSSTVQSHSRLSGPLECRRTLAHSSGPLSAHYLTPADDKAFGVTAAPKGELANTPVQTAHACTAGSLAAKPMLSLIVQEMKMPMAVEMGRKALARDGDALTGPWDAGNVHAGVDGTQMRFFKGSVSVQLPDERHGRRSQDRAHRDRQAGRRSAVGPTPPAGSGVQQSGVRNGTAPPCR